MTIVRRARVLLAPCPYLGPQRIIIFIFSISSGKLLPVSVPNRGCLLVLPVFIVFRYCFITTAAILLLLLLYTAAS